MKLLYLLFVLLVCLIQTTSGKSKKKNLECEKMCGAYKYQNTHGCVILPEEFKSQKKHCCIV
ncbi:Beta-defensin 33 [Bos mutus]|uniref:Beta-defensin 33 n=1 Tax=Bos mutus TaxID=72004 RepID=L8HP53_9CETA|nr:Beta-defensin 33 [Bos mutus]